MTHAFVVDGGDHLLRDGGRAALLPTILYSGLERSVWGGQNAAQYPDLDQAGFVRSGEARFNMLMPAGSSCLHFCCDPGSLTDKETAEGFRFRLSECLAPDGAWREVASGIVPGREWDWTVMPMKGRLSAFLWLLRRAPPPASPMWLV